LNASAPLIAGLEDGQSNRLPLFGAGLIGDYALNPSVQFCGSHVDSQRALGVIFSEHVTPYYRIMHGCIPLDGIYHRVTRAEGAIIHELDGKPVVKMIDELYGHQQWREATPVDLLTIGIYQGEKFAGTEEDRYVNRLITGILPDGKGICLFEPDVEAGTEVQFMVRDGLKMIESAQRNSSALMEQIQSEGKQAVFGLYISCAGRTAAYSKTAAEEASEVQRALNRFDCPLFGFYSGVEIAPFLGKSRGLDWTGLLLVFTKDGSHAA
jgi:small ligand-binding sensory domain FIST